MFHNSSKYLISLALLLSACLSLPARAVDLTGLYRAEVAVKSQTRDERFEVYPAAMAQVLVKLTGDRNVPDLPQLSGLVTNAVKLVQQFGYQELPADFSSLEEGYNRMLVVNFDANGIRQALIEAGVPIWGRTRPEVLLWLAVEDRGARYLLADGTSAELQNSLASTGAARALPLMLPLLDLEDQMQLGFADIWGDFRTTILTASERYRPDAVLVGRMFRETDGRWQARWTLYETGAGRQAWRWQDEGNDQPAALAGGVEGAADRIAQRYAQVYSLESLGLVSLSVTGVQDLRGYARAMQYLESLDVVSSVSPARVRDDAVVFKLDVRGDMAGLARAISLGNTLIPGERPVLENETEIGQVLVYQLMP